MAYRNELDAARARTAALEGELAEERERARDLERQLADARAPSLSLDPAPKPSSLRAPLRRSDPGPGRSLAFGRIHYHPPATYVPFLRLYVAALRAAFACAPTVGRPTSERVVAWVAYGLKFPLVYALWLPAYCAGLCIVLPVAAAVALVATVVLLPIIPLGRFSFASEPPAGESGWFHGDSSEEAGAVFLTVVVMLPPLTPLLLVFHRLLEHDGKSD